MKFKLLFALLLLAYSFSQVSATTSRDLKDAYTSQQDAVSATVAQLNSQEILDLTPTKFKAATGKRLSIKEAIALKKMQKSIKKGLANGKEGKEGNPKSQVVAAILAFVLGYLGIHRFYLGYTTIGIIQLLTAGGCGIWALIDFIMILTGDLKPADGSDYEQKI